MKTAREVGWILSNFCCPPHPKIGPFVSEAIESGMDTEDVMDTLFMAIEIGLIR